ncbi:hypothetical protein BGY98DRAFT_970545 [Russula aff. rugulosa BPL654]|nr:hypothetical protein BGY98DRAFT_970545 [Russula aff. rugulosa BPL654]
MSTLRHSLRNLFQRKSIGSVPFYEARQPWWARFTWGFIAADLFWTLPPEKPGDEPVRRPTWQRAGLCLGHLTLGAGLATLLLIARSRVVRILHIFPPSAAGGGTPKQLLIAGAHVGKSRGAVVPFARTRIEPGRDKTEAILRIQDVRGHWWIDLTRARLRGTPVSAARMRDALLAEWGIRKSSSHGDDLGATSSGRWKSGPVLEN